MENASNLIVPKSIVNPNVNNNHALDLREPFSFLHFIKIIEVPFTADQIQPLYIDYLKKWNRIKNIKESADASVIIERYRDFIRDVNLNYTSVDEKKFLSQIDFNDPLDLDLVIPFYSRKLIEISKYYNQKREENKYQIIKKKLIGTNKILTQELKNNILNYLENVDDGGIYYDIEDFKKSLKIDVDELYDTYPRYFNQLPNDRIYDNKDLDYGLDIFLKDNEEIINDVFSGFTQSEIDIREIDDLLDNKRKLTQKYIGSDFYYLSTGSVSSDFVSGMLFSAENQSQNFLNVDYPTTASNSNHILVLQEDIGFFRPHKTSIINIDGNFQSFKFNFENVKPNTVYYFPDPTVRGGNNTIITTINDDDHTRRNFTSGKAKVIPKSEKNDSKYYGYTSKIELSENKYLDTLSEIGYLQDSKKDIYNNLYGLVKDDNSFTKSLTSYNSIPNYFQILNGHTFYDYYYGEGFGFDYVTVDDSTYDHTSRSGLSTYTNGFSAIDRFYQIFGGKFDDGQFFYDTEYLQKFQTFDNIFLMNGESPYIDSFSSDLSGFELSGDYYYTELVEGGIHRTSPLQRALLDVTQPSITANLTQNIIPDYTTSYLVDGMYFTSKYEELLPTIPKVYYDDTVTESSVYTVSSSPTNNYYDRCDLTGSLYVRNSYTLETSKIEDALTYLNSVLPSTVYNEVLSAVKKFEVYSDVLVIETENNLILTKINYDNGVFYTPKNQTFIKPHGGKVSNRFAHNNKIYFTIIENVSSNNVNALAVHPTIYEFDVVKHYLYDYDTTSLPNIQTSSATFSTINPPTLSFNGRKNMFSISYLVKNPSNNFILVETEYEMNPFEIIKHYQYNQI